MTRDDNSVHMYFPPLSPEAHLWATILDNYNNKQNVYSDVCQESMRWNQV
jgi:hypothetical protein